MKNNKGFSLVELIIVIAIMAILVGVMAPQLIKYIEKTNVSADAQFCDSVKMAFMYSALDPSVVSADDLSEQQIEDLMDGTVWTTNTTVADSEFTEAVKETLGFDVFSTTACREKMKSTPAKSSGVLSCQVIDGAIFVWIDHSDASGKKNDYTAASASDLANGVIYVD